MSLVFNLKKPLASRWDRMDPTRSTVLRRQFLAELRRRFARVRKALIELVRDQDAFGLVGNASFFETCERDERGHCTSGGLKQQAVGLSDGHKQTIRDYQETGLYDPLNSYLRTGKLAPTSDTAAFADDLFQGGFDSPESKGWAKQQIEDMDAAIAKSRTTEQLVTYRGLPASVVASVSVGDVIRDKGFSSTSLDREVAEGFAERDGAILRIIVPKGSKALYADPIVDLKQHEVILPRGSGFKVARVSESNGKKVLHVTLTDESSSVDVKRSPTKPTPMPKETQEAIYDAASRYGANPEKIARSIYRTKKINMSADAIKAFLAANMVANDSLLFDPLGLAANLASTQIDLPQLRLRVEAMQRRIDPVDVLKFPSVVHVTIFYGLLSETPDETQKALAGAGVVRLSFGDLDVFENDEEDVLIVRVKSGDLERLHERLAVLPNEQTHADYQPHMTIAYLKPGSGRKYVSLPNLLIDATAGADKIEYSNTERNKTTVTLNCGGKGGTSGPCATQRASSSKSLQELYESHASYSHAEIEEHVASHFAGKSKAEALTSLKGFGISTPARSKRHAVEMATRKIAELKESAERGAEISDRPPVRDAGTSLPFDIKDRKVSERPEFEGFHPTMPKRADNHTEKGANDVGESSSEGWREVAGGRGVRGRDHDHVQGRGDGSQGSSGLELESVALAVQQAQVLGRRNDSSPTVNAPGRWHFMSDPDKLKAFAAWVKKLLTSEIVGKTEDELWKRFVQQAFEKGAGRSFDDVRMPQLRKDSPELFLPGGSESISDFYRGSKEEFLRSAFGRPVAIDKVKLLAARTYGDLKTVADGMENKLRQALISSFARGEGVRQLTKDIAKFVDGGLASAERIARTEVTRAHAQGQLMALRQMGVQKLGVSVEWSTANDTSVCELCRPLEGVVLDIDEAEEMLPRHPNCRCALIPANVGEEDEDQIDTKRGIDKAIRTSVKREGGSGASRWVGADLSVSKQRPKSIFK